MTAAKATFSIDDRSTSVVSLSGVTVGAVYVGQKGDPFTAKIITNPAQLRDYAGDFDPKYGISLKAAMRYLDEGNKLYLSRAVSTAALCGGALVRGQVEELPQGPVKELPDNCLAIKGLDKGISWDGIKSYSFPTYLTSRTYADPKVTVSHASDDPKILHVTSNKEFKIGDRIVVSGDDKTVEQLNAENDLSLPFATVNNVVTEDKEVEIITLSAPTSVAKGTEVKYINEEVATSYSPKIFTTDDVVDSTTVPVSDSDMIDFSTQIVFGDVEDQHTVENKDIVPVTQVYLSLDSALTAKVSNKVFIISKYEMEDLDAFLVYTTPGIHAKDISVGIERNKDYEEAFNLVVYHKGERKETHEVTRTLFLDGFNRQMFIEDKVNTNSKLIKVLNNPLCKYDPKPTTGAVWLKNPIDIFQDASVEVTDDVLVGHIQVYVKSVGTLKIGDRIKLKVGTNPLGEEYKIKEVKGNSIILDRKSNTNYLRKDGKISIYVFDPKFEDADNGIYEGIQHFSLTKLDKSYPNNNVGDTLVISGVDGTLVDTGTGHLLGGDDGNTVSTGELMMATKAFKSRGKTPINALYDAGIISVPFAQELLTIGKALVDCHVYLSMDPAVESSADPLQGAIEYRQKLGIDDRTASLFTGWIRRYDEINQIYVWEPPSVYALNAQSFVTRTKTEFTPAAGLVNGQILGLDVMYKWDDGEMDILTDNQINPIKYDNGTIVIWGNETLQKRPGPLQLRSVNWLLISLQVKVRSLNEYRLFDFNNESTWGPLEGAVNAILRDDYKAKGGLYDYSVAMTSIITDTDIDNRKAPLFIGLQPTMDIRQIDTTIAIFNKGSEISVG